jgi:hypothetical protein
MGVDSEVEQEAASFCRCRQDPVIRASSIIDINITIEVHTLASQPYVHHVCPTPINASEVTGASLTTIFCEGHCAQIPHVCHRA